MTLTTLVPVRFKPQLSRLALAALLPLAACGGGGGDAGGSGFGPASPFTGNYDVDYVGDVQGHCSVQVLSSGTVSGSCVDQDGVSEALTGTVTNQGVFSSTLGSVNSGGQFSGTLDSQSGTGSGNWASTAPRNGTWTLHPPSVAVTSAPSLDAPQAGSTLAVGNGLEGVWRSRTGDADVMSISAADDLFLYTSTATDDKVRGAVIPVFTPTGSFTLDTSNAVAFNDASAYQATGYASFTAKRTLGLNYNRTSGGGSQGGFSGTYDTLNALAVSQNSLQGSWTGSDSPELQVDAAGNLSGRSAGSTLGVCQFSGTLTQTAAGTGKNLFTVSLNVAAVPGQTCQLNVGGAAYTGYAALRVINVGASGQPYYKQALELIASQGSAKAFRLAANRI